MKKPVIGITTGIINYQGEVILNKDRLYVSKDYSDKINELGAIPILIPVLDGSENIDYYTDLCDGFIFTAGYDIHPMYYDEDPYEKIGFTTLVRDRMELDLMKEVIEKDKPILGICRGSQLLNVCQGGTLYQDMSEKKGTTLNHVQRSEGYHPSHRIEIKEGNVLHDILGGETWVNSYHHQAVKDLGEDIEVLAEAKDGIIEAIQLKDRKFILGVQWHPELMVKNSDEMEPIFEKFIEATGNR